MSAVYHEISLKGILINDSGVYSTAGVNENDDQIQNETLSIFFLS